MLVTLVATELCPALFGPPAGAASNPIKPVLTGLLDRNSQPPSDYLDKMDGWVVRVNWSDLQTSQGAPIAANNAIDQAIAAVRALGAQYPMRLKIRVLAGTSAPLWAKSLDGPPVQLDSYPGDTVGRFWTTNFGNAYADLQSKLAAMYDSVPQVAETEVTRCTIWTGEPFLRDAGTPSTVRALLAAGYTAALDQTCQQAEIDAHKVWTTTPSGLAFNPYQHLNADASSTTDEAFTESMMTYCRSSLGQRCVLANNSIRSTQQGSNYQSMYAAMQRLQRPMAFQTAGPQQVGDWYQASLSAVQYGANSIELADNYSTQPYDPAQMAYIRQLLKGAAVSGSPSPVAPGGTLTVNWSGIASPSTTDWVGLFAASSAADTAYLTWKYTGTTAGNGTMALTVPTNASPASTYELRLFSNNGYTRLATSTPITVAAASCSDPRVC